MTVCTSAEELNSDLLPPESSARWDGQCCSRDGQTSGVRDGDSVGAGPCVPGNTRAPGPRGYRSHVVKRSLSSRDVSICSQAVPAGLNVTQPGTLGIQQDPPDVERSCTPGLSGGRPTSSPLWSDARVGDHGADSPKGYFLAALDSIWIGADSQGRSIEGLCVPRAALFHLFVLMVHSRFSRLRRRDGPT